MSFVLSVIDINMNVINEAGSLHLTNGMFPTLSPGASASADQIRNPNPVLEGDVLKQIRFLLMYADVTASMVNLPREDFSKDLAVPDALTVSIGDDADVVEEGTERKSWLART